MQHNSQFFCIDDTSLGFLSHVFGSSHVSYHPQPETPASGSFWKGDPQRETNRNRDPFRSSKLPSEHSTGPHRRLGAITKAGNSHLRRVLVESAWAYRLPARVTRIIRLRQEQLPSSVCEIAWRAQLRLCTRYRRLVARGKCKQLVATAIARELVAFMWAIAREVQLTPATLN